MQENKTIQNTQTCYIHMFLWVWCYVGTWVDKLKLVFNKKKYGKNQFQTKKERCVLLFFLHLQWLRRVWSMTSKFFHGHRFMKIGNFFLYFRNSSIEGKHSVNKMNRTNRELIDFHQIVSHFYGTVGYFNRKNNNNKRKIIASNLIGFHCLNPTCVKWMKVKLVQIFFFSQSIFKTFEKISFFTSKNHWIFKLIQLTRNSKEDWIDREILNVQLSMESMNVNYFSSRSIRRIKGNFQLAFNAGSTISQPENLQIKISVEIYWL